MAGYTPVYGDFVERLNEVSLLRKKSAALERSKLSFSHGDEISAMCRGAVVLLSSHVEAYVKEVGEHTLEQIFNKGVCRSRLAPQFFYHASKDSIKAIKDSAQPDQIAGHIHSFVQHEAVVWGTKNPLPTPIGAEQFNQGFSNPKFDKVKAYFGRFGYTEFRQDFYRKLGRDALPTETSLNLIVDTRNQIAHGNPAATRTPGDVRTMEQNAKVFCRTADKIFADWCKSNLCAIR